MTIRHFQIKTEGSQIFIRIAIGHATIPMVQRLEIDAATALAMAGELESAVHRTATAGLELFDGKPTPAREARPAAEIAASAALPIETAF